MSTTIHPMDPRRRSLVTHDLDGAGGVGPSRYERNGLDRGGMNFNRGGGETASSLRFSRAKSGIMGERGLTRFQLAESMGGIAVGAKTNDRSLFGGDGLNVNTGGAGGKSDDPDNPDDLASNKRDKPTSPITNHARSEHRSATLGLFYGVVSEVQRHNDRMELLKRRCIVLPGSKFRRIWDLLSLVLLMYVAIFTPVQIAFFGDAMSISDWRDWLVIFMLDRLVDVIFIIDIFINFRTAWKDAAGEDIFDSRVAATKYLKGWFLLDVVSIFPFDFIDVQGSTENSVGYGRIPKLIRLLRLAKIFKVLRMSRILRRWEAAMHVRYGVLRLSKFFLWSIVAAHWVACAWFIIGTLDEMEGWVTTHHLTIDLYHVTRGEQYVASLYWSVMTLTTIGYGDIKPVTAVERLFAILAMLLGSAMFAYVVGTMCSVVQGLSETQLHFQSHMDRINEYMTECKLPNSLRTRVRKFCLYQRDANLIRMRERNLLQSLSPALRSEISSHNYELPLRRAEYFSDAPREFIYSLSEYLCLAIFGPNEAIIRSGFTGSKMYILSKGRCQVEYCNVHTGDVKIVGELTDGNCFGELAMLFESRRSATIRTLCFCETLFLRRDSYLSVAAHFPRYAKKVRKRAIKVMWRNMLTSHTLKQALLNAAHLRQLQLERQNRRPSTMDLAESMQELMGNMTERLKQYESMEKRHKMKDGAVKNAPLDDSREKFSSLQMEDPEGAGVNGMEILQRENRRLRKRLTDEGIEME